VGPGSARSQAARASDAADAGGAGESGGGAWGRGRGRKGWERSRRVESHRAGPGRAGAGPGRAGLEQGRAAMPLEGLRPASGSAASPAGPTGPATGGLCMSWTLGHRPARAGAQLESESYPSPGTRMPGPACRRALAHRLGWAGSGCG
jgi:hypothetical protein